MAWYVTKVVHEYYECYEYYECCECSFGDYYKLSFLKNISVLNVMH